MAGGNRQHATSTLQLILSKHERTQRCSHKRKPTNARSQRHSPGSWNFVRLQTSARITIEHQKITRGNRQRARGRLTKLITCAYDGRGLKPTFAWHHPHNCSSALARFAGAMRFRAKMKPEEFPSFFCSFGSGSASDAALTDVSSAAVLTTMSKLSDVAVISIEPTSVRMCAPSEDAGLQAFATLRPVRMLALPPHWLS